MTKHSSPAEMTKDKPLLKGPHNTTYATVCAGVTLSMETFYRETNTQGLSNLPKYRGCIIASNHWNMATDIGALMQTCPRKVHFWTKAELFKGPVLVKMFMEAMGCLPVKRNSRSGKKESNDNLFQHTINTLIRGGVIAIFPEGTSHHTAHVTDLKDGASWAALQNAAATADPADYAPVVPVGITYEPIKYTWRNRVHVRYGTPVEMEPFLEEFATDQRSAVKKLTAAIQQGLKSVTINAPDWETLDEAYRMQSVVLGHTACAGDLESITIILDLLKEKSPAFVGVVGQVDEYYLQLKAMGLKDRDLEIGNVPKVISLVTNVAIHLFFALVSLIYILPSFVLHLPWFLVVLYLKHSERFPESKAQKQIFSSYVLLPMSYTLVYFVLTSLAGATTWWDKVWYFSVLMISGFVFPRAEDYRRQAFNTLGTSVRLLFARAMCGRSALNDVLHQRDLAREALSAHIDPIKRKQRTIDERKADGLVNRGTSNETSIEADHKGVNGISLADGALKQRVPISTK
ncbi:hypothetical protein DFJ77DRAFT_449436 [Powellomyces hirtus]|nr:hypothetical protein DFJ77DRAFT_449436 [Powellomyces hirtus]